MNVGIHQRMRNDLLNKLALGMNGYLHFTVVIKIKTKKTRYFLPIITNVFIK